MVHPCVPSLHALHSRVSYGGGGGGGGGGAGIRGIFDVKNTCRLSVSGIDICLFMCRFMQWCLSMLIFLKLHLNNES